MSNFASVLFDFDLRERSKCRFCKKLLLTKSIRVKVPEYGSKFLSTGQLLAITVHKGSRVRVEVPEYGSRFPSTDFGKIGEDLIFITSLWKCKIIIHSLL